MKLFSDSILGIKHSFQAISFTNKHKLWRYFWLPAILSLGIFLGVGLLFYKLANVLTAVAEQQMQENFSETWLYTNGKWLLNIVIYLLSFLFYIKSYRVAMSIFLSPFLGNLAEKVQLILHPEIQEGKFEMSTFVKNFFRGLVITLINLFIELSFSIFLLILGLIFPLISPFCTVLAFCIEWYFIGFSMIDLRNEFFEKGIGESYSIVWRHKFFAIAVGGCCFLLILIPFVGIFLAPCLTTIAAGTGIAALEKKKLV